MNFFI